MSAFGAAAPGDLSDRVAPLVLAHAHRVALQVVCTPSRGPLSLNGVAPASHADDVLIDTLGWRRAYVALAATLPVVLLLGTALIATRRNRSAWSPTARPDAHRRARRRRDAAAAQGHRHIRRRVVERPKPPEHANPDGRVHEKVAGAPLEAPLKEAAAPALLVPRVVNVGFSTFWAGSTSRSSASSRRAAAASPAQRSSARTCSLPPLAQPEAAKLLTSAFAIDPLSPSRRTMLFSVSNAAVALISAASLTLRTERHVVVWARSTASVRAATWRTPRS